MAYYTNIVPGDRPGAAVVWHIAAIELVTMMLVGLLKAAERGVVGFQCYDHWMGQGSCGVLVPLSSDVRRRVCCNGFVSFVVGCVFDSDRAYLANCRPAEVDWSSIDGLPCWFIYGFADGRVHDLVVVVLPS